MDHLSGACAVTPEVLLDATVVLAAGVTEGAGSAVAIFEPSSSHGTLRTAFLGTFTHLAGGFTSTVCPLAAAAAAFAALALCTLTATHSFKLKPWQRHTLGGPPWIGLLRQPHTPFLQQSASLAQGWQLSAHCWASADTASCSSSSTAAAGSSACRHGKSVHAAAIAGVRRVVMYRLCYLHCAEYRGSEPYTVPVRQICCTHYLDRHPAWTQQLKGMSG